MATKQKTEKEEKLAMEPIQTDPKKIKKNDLMAFTYYGVVETIQKEGDILAIRGVAGSPISFEVKGNSLVVSSFSADQYQREETVSMTAAAEILVKSYNRPLTVVFTKSDEEERTLRGRLVEPEPLLGRSLCEDLDVTEGSRFRLVDHRTIKSLIVNGIKYTVKGKK